MSFPLLFLFLFQGGLAFAFTYFMASIFTREAEPKHIRYVRNGILCMAAFLSPVCYIVYRMSLPEGEPTYKAFWPALWIFIILLSISLGITVALLKRPGHKT